MALGLAPSALGARGHRAACHRAAAGKRHAHPARHRCAPRGHGSRRGVFTTGPLASSSDTLINPGLGNNPPKADRQDVVVKQDRPRSITLTGSDGDGNGIIFAVTKQPDHGTLSGQAPDVVYTPDPGYLGRDDFSFRTIDDPGAVSNTAKVSLDVVPLGTPPSVTASSGCTAYLARKPAVVVDGGLTVSDPDDATLAEARVRIAGNFEQGDDLRFTDQNGIRSAYDDETGVLHLTGTASVAAYEAALRTVSYRNLSSPHPSATKGIEFTVNDAGSDSAPATKQVCISDSGTSDRPVGTASEGGLDYTEDDGPVPVDGGFDAFEPGSTQIAGATIAFVPSELASDDELGQVGPPQFTNGFSAAEDRLAFTDQNGITGSYDGDAGVLTLTGLASVADYEAAIRSATYENVSENPSDAPRTVRFQFTDANGAASLPTSRQIFVTPVNDAPVATASDGATAFTEGDPATAVDPGLTVGDVDDTELEGAQVRIADGLQAGDALSFTDQLGIAGTYDAEAGVLTLTGTASVGDYETALRSVAFSQTSDDPTASKTVELTVNDGELDSAPAAKTIAITPVNDKPVLDASDDGLSYTEGDGAVAVDSGLTATDPDSTNLIGATVQISGNFAPGEDRLAFTDTDAISGSYQGDTGTLTLSGTASVADYEAALRSVTYENTSDDPSTATRTVSFQVDDGSAAENLSDAVTRDVAVTPVNDAPAVTTSDGATSYTVGGDAAAVDSALSVSDPDDANLESAQVRISDGFQQSDELVFADQAGISGSYDASTGVLSLTGSASVSDYEAALRSVGFQTSADQPSDSKTVELTVNDGDADSNAATKSIALSQPTTDAAPVVTTTDAATQYTLGDPGAAVDSGLTVSDADDVDLEGAQVRISDGFDSGDDLIFVDQAGISGVYNTSSGVLTLTGTAPVADYETALRSILYRHVGDDPPSTTSKTVEFKVNDGDLDSNAAFKPIALSQAEL